jgi:hypothetical protein
MIAKSKNAIPSNNQGKYFSPKAYIFAHKNIAPNILQINKFVIDFLLSGFINHLLKNGTIQFKIAKTDIDNRDMFINISISREIFISGVRVNTAQAVQREYK